MGGGREGIAYNLVRKYPSDACELGGEHVIDEFLMPVGEDG